MINQKMRSFNLKIKNKRKAIKAAPVQLKISKKNPLASLKNNPSA